MRSLFGILKLRLKLGDALLSPGRLVRFSVLLLLLLNGASSAALKDYNWSLSGSLLPGADSVEVYLAVRNDSAITAFSVEVYYDTTLLELAEPLENHLALAGRAADLEFFPSKLEDWGFVRLTVFSTVPTAPFPELEAGSGAILKLSFKVKTPLETGASTTLQLKLKNGTLLSTYQLTAREFTGVPGDVDGNAKIDIFDLLELLKVLGGNGQESLFSDVDQNGKTDIFDLLRLLTLLAK